MQCTNPRNYNEYGNYLSTVPPCGKCLACLTTRRYEWASRLMLEATAHEKIQFVTLTYSEQHLPDSASELKRHFQNWRKALTRVDGHAPRYYACMEYGTLYGRAHWHVILFGRSSSFETRRTPDGKKYRVDPAIEDTWKKGLTYSKDCMPGAQVTNVARYVVNYLLKNTWSDSDESRQEFSLKSRRPYLGKPAVKWLSELIGTRRGLLRCMHLGTIPDKVHLAGKIWKIPLRMRKEIAELTDFPVTEVPHNDATVVSFATMDIIVGKPRKPISFVEANVNEQRLAKKIERLKTRSAHRDGT